MIVRVFLLDTVLLSLGSGLLSSLCQLRPGVGLLLAWHSNVALPFSDATTSVGALVMTGGCAETLGKRLIRVFVSTL